jgi:putative ABC transport system permease protein
VRLALGATRRSVCALVLGRALTMTAIGAAIGIAGSVAIAPLLRGLLFETPPVDPPTYMVVLGSLALLTIAASLVPARRAMSVDPLTALRSD